MTSNSYHCKCSKNCDIYRNWVEQTKDKRLNIIQKQSEKSPFSCLAFEALNDAETGISKGKDLEGKSTGDNCSHILELNLIRELFHKLGYKFK